MKEWSFKRLSDVAMVSAGNPAPQGEAPFEAGHLPFIRTSDVGRVKFGYIGETADLLNGPGAAKLRLVPKGSILFPKSGASTFLDHRVMTEMDAYVASHLAVIQVDREVLIPRFALFYLSTIRSRDLVQDQNYPSLNLKTIGRIPIPVPPIGEQKRIVVILDEAFAAIEAATANAEKNVANSAEVFEGLLGSVLNDVATSVNSTKLSDITECIVDCEHKTAPTQDTGYPSIRTPNVGRGVLMLDDVRRVSEETYRLWTRREVPRPGDLILAREAPAGNVGVIPEGQSVCLGQRTVLIRPNQSDINPYFLAFYLLHPRVQDRLLSKSVGATVEHVNMRDIRALPVSVFGSMESQDSLVDQLRTAREKSVELARIYTSKADQLNELKEAILTRAFSGDLDIGELDLGPALEAAVG